MESIFKPQVRYAYFRSTNANFVMILVIYFRIIKNLMPKYIRGPSGPEAKMAHRLNVGKSMMF